MQQRTTHGAPAPTPIRPATLHVAAFFVIAAAVLWWMHRAHFASWRLEDLPVYSRALHDWQAGQNPYNAKLAPLYFLYPPVFLFLASFAGHLLPAHWGPTVFGVAHITATCALPLVLARYFFRQNWLDPLFALLLFFASPRFTGVLALSSGNVASILYCLTFVAAAPGLRRNRWEWFYLAVFLAAIVKISFLALLLLPVLAGRRQWLRAIACGTAVVAANLGERALWPALYRGYQWSLQQGILTEQSFGYGVFGALATYHYRLRGIGMAADAVSGLLAALLVSLMLLLRRRLLRAGRRTEDLASNGVWLALVVLTAVAVNPRLMQYDMDIALFAGFVLWVYGLQTQRLLLLMTMLFLPTLVVPLVVLNPHMHGLYETVLVLGAFALAYWRMWREAGWQELGVRQDAPNLIVKDGALRGI